MERFLLENAALYQKLVRALEPKPVPASQKSKRPTEISSPDMVVSARIRPLLNEDSEVGFPCAVFPRANQSGVVDIHDLYNHPRGRPILKSFNYEVDRLYNEETTTEEIYNDLVVGLVPFAWSGGIGTLFTYGQTGSGKTFTVSRLEQLVAGSLMDGNMDGQRQVYITIIDLAGNSAYDLLNSRNPISILEDSFGVTQLAGANEHLVQSKEEVMELIERAVSFRPTARTMKNDASSRSHGICRIRIHDPAANTDGLLYLIDLAGSEAARDIVVHGADRMRETREINMSLSVLKDCIRGKVQSDALRFSGAKSGKRPHVPFRQSALTKVLKHVFDPAGRKECKTVVVACLNPSLADVGPSKNTLRYAEMLRVFVPVKEVVEVSEGAPMDWSNERLREWIGKNSGTPPISATILAPTESGAQLLLLPPSEIEGRCLKTSGVSIEQAKAFRSKLWQLHIDSQHGSSALKISAINASDSKESKAMSGQTRIIERSSSRDLDTTAMTLPFQERIRPGMVISYKPLPINDSALGLPEGLKLAIVLCPLEAVHAPIKDIFGNVVGAREKDYAKVKNIGAKYLCALVKPALMAEAYELSMWQQVVIDVEMMDKEVVLEYDSGTRYYYISV